MVLILNEMLNNLWDKIKELDSSLVVYPWKDGSTDPSIRSFESVSKTSLSDIRVYFHRAAPRETGGFNYFSAYLGHDVAFKKIKEDMEHWLFRTDVQAGWWYRPLQCEETLKLGWLFGSVREMDADILAAEIKRKSGVKVGLRFKTIAVARGVALSKDEMIQALHIEIDVKDEKRRTAVENLYSKRASWYPLGMKMRLVLERNQLSVLDSLAKWDRMRNFHSILSKDTQWFDDEEIAVLDYKDSELGNKTLRQVIMATRSADGTKPLFITVARRFRGNGARFVVRNNLADEADALVNGGILSYLRATLDQRMQKALEKCFMTKAIARADLAVWDPVKKCVVSHADRMLDDFDASMLEEFSLNSYDLEEKEGVSAGITLSNMDALQDRLLKTRNEGREVSLGDSVSTFRNAAEKRAKGYGGASEASEASDKSNRTKTRTRSAASSVSSVSASAATMSRIEKEMADMKTKSDAAMGQLQSQVDTMSMGINQITRLLLEQNSVSKPADSQSAVAGREK